jgi:hypothetical protein
MAQATDLEWASPPSDVNADTGRIMFEKLLELLTALAVAAAGIAGIGTAAEHADPPASDAALSHLQAQVDEFAAIRAAIADRAAAVLAELDALDTAELGPTDGLEQATEALTEALDNAPDQADDGLRTAMDAVTTSPANDAPAGPPEELPVELPAGPPADLPGGRP